MLRLTIAVFLGFILGYVAHAWSTSKHVQVSEDTCREIARQGETWEDACERVFDINPNAWSSDGTL